jgi:hypothetical protein
VDYALETPVIPLVGRIDLREPDQRTITDHKTTSDERWAVAETQLPTNVQAVIYCQAEFEARRTIHALTFRHIYYLTRGQPRSYERKAEIRRPQNLQAFEQLFGELEAMKALSHELDASNVEPSKAACGDYGGCRQAHLCKRIDGPQGLFGMGLKDRLKKKKMAASDNKASKGLSLAERLAAKKAQVDKAASKIKDDARARGLTAAKAAERMPSTAERDPDPPNPPDGTPRDEVGTVGKDGTRGLKLPSGTLIKSAKLAELLEHFDLPRAMKAPEIAGRFGVELDDRTRTPLLKDLATMEALGELPPPVTDGPSVPVNPSGLTTQGTDAAGFVQAAQDKPREEAPTKPAMCLAIDAIPELSPLPVVYLEELLRPFEATIDGFAYVEAYRDGQRRAADWLDSEIDDILTERGRFVLVVRSTHPAAPECLVVLRPRAVSILRGVSL